jgi:hypothetical protein
MTADTGPDGRMPAEVDGKQVISAFRRMPTTYGSLAYSYVVIVDEARRDDETGMNMYTVGTAEWSRAAGAWTLTPSSLSIAMVPAMREFAQLAYSAARAASSER